jgi:hypothetical protein
MKKHFFLILLLSFAHASKASSQKDTSYPGVSLTYKYNFLTGYRFFENGEKISFKKGKRLLWENPKSAPYMRQHRTWYFAGMGACLLGCATSLVLRNNNPNFRQTKPRIWIIAPATVPLVFTIPFVIPARRKLRQAVNAYSR